MLYSYKGAEPTILPERIRLSNGMTRTDSSTFTQEEIEDAGYKQITQEKPYGNRFQKVVWTGDQWLIVDMTLKEINETIENQWKQIRLLRDDRIKDVMWRVERYLSEVRQNIPKTEKIAPIDNYIQALRDITKQTDPFNIVWPELEGANITSKS